MILPTGSRPWRTPCGGMTFIELIMVVIIISILAVPILINFRTNFNAFQLNNSARELQSFMNYLHERAIVDGKQYNLSIDNDHKEYGAQVQGVNKSYSIPKELTITVARQGGSSDSPIFFNPDGQIEKVTIQISADETHSVSLTTEGVFGRVKLTP